MLMSILFVLVALSVIIPVSLFYKTGKKNGKQCLIMNIVAFFGIVGVAAIAMLANGASALAASEAANVLSTGDGLKFIGAALSTGLSGIGGGVAVASSASAAIGAMSENEKIMGKTLIFVAMAEGIALYGLVISFLILNS